MGTKGSASAHVDAPPDVVFAFVTELDRLPQWNDRVEAVLERPDTLDEGAEWVVAMRIMGRRFTSRSHVIELDRPARRFAYRSKPEDDNPSFTIWTWSVDPERDPPGHGSLVTLRWELRPATLLRKRVIAPLRARQIERTEAPASLAALARAVRSPSG
jgi:uncharacterized protein YndB with AHSA1/START domain